MELCKWVCERLCWEIMSGQENKEKSISWRSMNDMNSTRSSSRAISFLMRMLILISHASFAPFVLYEPIISFLSEHLYKISQESHELVVGNQASMLDWQGQKALSGPLRAGMQKNGMASSGSGILCILARLGLVLTNVLHNACWSLACLLSTTNSYTLSEQVFVDAFPQLS